jgi:hypothetical protein
MSISLHRSFFAWFAYRLLWLIAIALIVLVICAPWVENKVTSRTMTIFARDVTLRRTAIASALGLIATACVFFRSPSPVCPPSQKPTRPPSDMAGA